ncbi:MAG: hypothetical protein P1U52_09600 [Porticoccaceae bacterium]|nr:hypothetical protein [Porticoccaceae bacterium]
MNKNVNEKGGIVIGREVQEEQSLKTITTVVYVLQAISFFIGITFIVGVIVNYINKSTVEGTWLESHFRWQIRTFWFSLLWSIIGFVLVFVLIGYVVLAADALWVIYRIARGWINMSAGKAMYQN